MESTCLITGGGGFVLMHVAREFLESAGGSRVVLFDRRFDDAVRALLAPYHARVVYFEGDVTDRGAWEAVAQEWSAQLTHIVAGAALTPTEADERAHSADVLRVNLFGCVDALELARGLGEQLRRFVFISSDAVYGTPGLARPEAWAAPPSGGLACASTWGDAGRSALPGLYALSKWTAECAVRTYVQLHGLRATIVRFADVYGAGDRDTGARNRHNAPYYVARRVAAGVPVRVHAASLDENGWDYVDVSSIARGVVALLRARSAPRRAVYDLASGAPVAHRALIAAAGGDAAVAAATLVGPAAARDVASLAAEHHLNRHSYDVSPMEVEFGWRATPLRDAMAAYVAALRADTTRDSALLGHTGYVGGNLAAQGCFTDLYNSRNIDALAGRRYRRIVCAAAPGFKLGATTLRATMEGRPYDDGAALSALKASLSRVECVGTFILISTLSVYAVTSDAESAALRADIDFDRASPAHCLDERRDVWSRRLARGGASDHAYGRNRAELERWVLEESKFKGNCVVVRLPGIFGPGLKKNYLFDLITGSQWLHKVDLNTRHQWYPLSRLTGDIDAVLAANAQRAARGAAPLRVVNLFPQDVSTEAIVRAFFPQHLAQCCRGGAPFVDAVRSSAAVRAVFLRVPRADDDDDAACFRFSAAETMEQLRVFFADGDGAIAAIRAAAAIRATHAAGRL